MDGNIIAAIIRVHSTRKPRKPRPMVPGPGGIPTALWTVNSQARAAAASNASQPARDTRRPSNASCNSGRPGERRGEGVLPVVGPLEPENIHSGCRCSPCGHSVDWESDAADLDAFTGRVQGRDEVLNVEIDSITSSHSVASPVIGVLD